MRIKLPILTTILGLAALMPANAVAGLIDGSQLNISGDAIVGAIAIQWLCDQAGDAAGCAVAPPNSGDFNASSSTGSFAQYNGTFGYIKDINDSAQPLNTAFSLPSFITFQLNNNLTIELTFIPLGTDTPSTDCSGLTHCTPQNALLDSPNNPSGLSAFNLDSNQNGTAASFGIDGIVHDNTGDTANITGIFTAQFAKLSPQQALAAALAGTNSTYSSNLSLTITTTPEPAEMLLTGAGLVLLALLRKPLQKSKG